MNVGSLIGTLKTSTPRDNTHSFNLEDNANLSDIDMSMTLDDEELAPTKGSTMQAECAELSSKMTDISLDESGVRKTVEGEEDLEQNSILNGTEQNTDIEAINEAQYPIEENELFQHALIELGRRLWKSSPKKQHYTKGCLWSPDGTCILVPVLLDGMHVIELPRDLYTEYLGQTMSPTRALSKLDTEVHVKEGGTVYDCVWYPFMNSNAPETCCWLASRQHEPIHMWDAFTGELRCTYRGYDSVDEVEAAIAITFSNSGERVIGGYKKSIKVFDTNVPGRDLSSITVKQAVSCFALTTNNDSTITTGSWKGFINHFDLRAPKLGPLFTLGGHTGGITWLRYAPLSESDSWLLYSGARKDNKILEWDMRNYLKPVREFTRTVETNQRIYFDLSAQDQRWLVSGETGGNLRIWDLQNNTEESLPLHGDCCNGVNFHPSLPILATTSGQHHFVDSSEDEDFQNMKGKSKQDEIIIDYENALRFWWIGKSVVDCEIDNLP